MPTIQSLLLSLWLAFWPQYVPSGFNHGATSSFTIGQTAVGTSGAGDIASLQTNAFASPNTAGNRIALGFTVYSTISGSPVPTATDLAGNSYACYNQFYSTSTNITGVCIAYSIAAYTSNKVTLAISGTAQYWEITAVEIGGAGSATDVHNGSTLSTAGTSLSTSVTTTVSGDLILSTVTSASGTSVTVGSGYTSITGDAYLQYQVVGSATTYTPGWSWTGNSTAVTEAIAIKP